MTFPDSISGLAVTDTRRVYVAAHNRRSRHAGVLPATVPKDGHTCERIAARNLEYWVALVPESRIVVRVTLRVELPRPGRSAVQHGLEPPPRRQVLE